MKHVNDTFGHDEGDRYLCAFVQTVQKHLRERDIFARVGGDVCSKETASSAARRGARRLKKQLCIKNPNPVFEVRIFLYLSSSVQTSFAILNAAQAFGQPA